MTPNDPNQGGNPGDWRDMRDQARRMRWEARAARRQARFANGGVYAGQGFHGRVFIGSIVLLLGILFLLENLGIFYVDRLWQFWPVILIGVGVARIFDSRGAMGQFGGLIIGAIGVLFLAINLGYLPPNVWRLVGPLLLILWGIVILIRGFGGTTPWNAKSFVHDASTTSNNVLREVAVFGGIDRKVDSQDFQGGEATAVFGGIELDLRGAAITRDEVRIEANAVFGGVEITVPENWDIVMQGAGVLGGYTDHTHRALATEEVKRPRVVIRGGAVFGGVNVRN